MIKHIYLLWLQGFDKVPPIVYQCIKSWKYYNPDWQIFYLTESNIHKLININLKKYKQLEKCHLSDIIRLLLLNKYGGVWADATTFCNKSFDNHENVLFDENGSKLIEEYNRYALNYNHQNPTSYTKLKTIPTTNNIKFFRIWNKNYKDCRLHGEQFYFLNFMIQILNGSSAGPIYTYYEHDLTIDNLFVIKHFQSSDIESGLTYRKTHPEYFKQSYSELDEKKEYIEIEKLMVELKILIDNNKQKKEYYESLEKRNSELEAEVKQLQNKATEIDEIKSLLKDQQEHVQIIQSLLKRINKLEDKVIINE